MRAVRVLLALLMLSWAGSAFAGACPAGGTCDAGEAYADCMGIATSQGEAKCQNSHPQVHAQNPRCPKSGSDTSGSFAATITCVYGPESASAGAVYSSAQQIDRSYYSKSCANRNTAFPPGDSAINVVPIGTCFGGCKVAGESYSYGSGGITFYGMRNRYYTGESCTGVVDANAPIDAKQEKEDQTKPKSQECTALANGQTGCVKPDGNYCATASTGKTFCWTPTETGEKKDGTQAQKKTVKDQPVTQPSVSVPDTEWQRNEGHQATACLGSTCITYNVTNFTQVPAGTAKNSTGNNAPDGSGNPTGNGDKSEDGKDSATDSGNCETPPICIGDTLKCLQLKFTWKINCLTQRNEVTNGGTCAAGDVPVCAGKSCKAEEYAQVLQQYRARCAAEEQRDKAAGDAASGAADAASDDEQGTVASLWSGDGVVPSLNQSRISIGGGEVIPTVELPGGGHFTIPQEFYNALAILKKIIIAAAMVAAFAILWNRL